MSAAAALAFRQIWEKRRLRELHSQTHCQFCDCELDEDEHNMLDGDGPLCDRCFDAETDLEDEN